MLRISDFFQMEVNKKIIKNDLSKINLQYLGECLVSLSLL